MFTLIEDAEAAVYAIEAGVCLCETVVAGDLLGSALNLVSLLGWTKNAMGL